VVEGVPRYLEEREDVTDFEWRRALHDIGPVPPEPTGPWATWMSVDPATVRDDAFFSVGVDAGTSGLRVACHHELTRDFRIHDFGRNPAGGSRFSFPAVAGVRDGVLLLGHDAVGLPASNRISSAKAGLVHPVVGRDLGQIWLGREWEGGPALAHDHGPGPADFLHAVLIARALEVALPPLIGLGKERTPYCTVNLGYPSSPSDLDREDRFERCLRVATMLVGCVGERPEVARLLGHYAAAWTATRNPLAPEYRRVEVRPEALAGIRSLSNVLQPGTNILCGDIGATTTDVGILRVGTDAIYVYGDASIPVGVDDLDRALEGIDVDLVDARRRRMAKRGWNGDSVRVPAMYSAVRSAIKLALKAARSANPDPSSWARMYVVLAGGGSNISGMRAPFDLSDVEHFITKTFHRLDLQIPARVRVVGATSATPRPAEVAEIMPVFGVAADDWNHASGVVTEAVIPSEDPSATRPRPRWV
jgi:hypothetical protein